METRSKRRKIQYIESLLSHQVSRPVSGFDLLNDDILTTILEFVGNKSYATFAGINKRCKGIYLLSGMKKETFLFGYGTLSAIINGKRSFLLKSYIYLGRAVGKGIVFYNRRDLLDWAITEFNPYVLEGICDVAAGEGGGKIDLLNEVFHHLKDNDKNKRDKRIIFCSADGHAAESGKLEVLEWFHTQEININKCWCARKAAFKGHLHVIKWLWSKGLRLDEYLFFRAIEGGGHLHVLKWLREKGCVFTDWTFLEAAKEGNLEVLQWLHEEGCLWDSTYRINETKLKPEAKDWLFANGYRDRVM